MADDPLELAAALVASNAVDAVQLAVRRGGVTTTAAFGACDDTTRFALASLTKPILATACLVACDEGVLDLDVEVSAYVPESPCRATLREVLSHASGLPADSAAARRTYLEPGSRWSNVAAVYAAVEPQTAPRTVRVYSNAGYALAAFALERAAGMPYDDYITAAVLAPLGMQRTTLGADPDAVDVVEVREPGLLGHGEQLFNGARFRALGLPQSGGYGSAEEYLRLLTCVSGVGPALLSAESRSELMTNQCGALPGGVGAFMEWDVCDWTVGFDVRNGKSPHWSGDALSPASVSHFGASGTLAFIDPARDVQAVLLANRGTYSRWMLEPGGWPDLCAALVA
jgi:CubicO group peptidase (beta-lactamase class C family)